MTCVANSSWLTWYPVLNFDMTGSTHNFIVTCPAVTAPQLVAGHTYPYTQNYTDMCALGFDLMQIAKRHVRGGEA